MLRFQNTPGEQHKLVMKGEAPSHVEPDQACYYELTVMYGGADDCRGMRYEQRVKAKNKVDKVTTVKAGIHATAAPEVELYRSAATSFNGFDKCLDKDGRDEAALAQAYLTQAFPKNFDYMKKAHVKDFQSCSKRVAFSLNQNLG